MKTCFFIGHRETDERILPTLIQEVEPVSYTHLDVYKRQVPHFAVEGNQTVKLPKGTTLPLFFLLHFSYSAVIIR